MPLTTIVSPARTAVLPSGVVPSAAKTVSAGVHVAGSGSGVGDAVGEGDGSGEVVGVGSGDVVGVGSGVGGPYDRKGKK